MMRLAIASTVSSTVGTLNQFTENDIENQEEQVENKNNDDDDDDDEEDQRKKNCLQKNVFRYGIQGLAVTTFGAALASTVLIATGLVDAFSILTLVLSPWVFWQKLKLQKMKGMRGQQNMLRSKVNRLSAENRQVTSSIDQLEEQVKKLQHVEQELGVYAEKAGGHVDRLVEIVKENGKIQSKIKKILDDCVLQQIITAMINSDRDNDHILNKREVRQLEHRLRNIPGIIFHHDRFQNFLESDQGDLTLGDVTHLARQMQDPSVPDTERVFEYDMQQCAKNARKMAAAKR